FYGCGTCLACRNTKSSKRHLTTMKEYINKEFTIRDQLTCFSKGVIYVLKCPCNLLYIGRTHTEYKKWIRDTQC
ncbi:Hypothetical predicted protein, partial [Pelobates cultripes]